MEMPKPTRFHQKLEALVGEWTGDEAMHASPMNPQEWAGSRGIAGPAYGRCQSGTWRRRV